MTTELISFGFDNHGIRVTLRDGEPWFVAKDVCDILEIGNTSQTVSYLDDDERDVITNDSRFNNWETIVISESGLYSLVFKSRKPEAKTFRKWVTSVVLPSIRKTGSYGVNAKTACLPGLYDSPLPPEAGGPVTVTDELGRELVYA